MESSEASPRAALPVFAVVPAFEAASTVGQVVSELVRAWPYKPEGRSAIVVVDDGSTDQTAEVAERAGATVVRHPKNAGKGAALRTGFELAHRLGATAAVTVDADRQHPTEEAVRLAVSTEPRRALLLGVRNLARDGAPRANQFSNGFSNRWLHWLTGRSLRDTQCGLRRYPLPESLELGAKDAGYAFEAEFIMRAAYAKWNIVEVPVRVYYPPESERTTHFHSVRDPAKIVYRVLATFATRERALRSSP